MVAGGIIERIKIQIMVINKEYFRQIAEIKSTFQSAVSSSQQVRWNKLFKFFFIYTSVRDLEL